MDVNRQEHDEISTPPFAPNGAPAKFSRTDSELIDAVVADMIGGQPVTVILGYRGAGEMSVRHALGLALQQHKFNVVPVTRQLQNPLAVQQLVSDMLGGETGKTPGPEKVLRTLLTAAAVGKIVLLIDGAENLSERMFRYLWLVVKLLQSNKTNLHLVLFGCSGRWPGLEHADLDKLREAAVVRIIKPRRSARPCSQVRLLPITLRRPVVAAVLGVTISLVLTVAVVRARRHAAQNTVAATTPVPLPPIQSAAAAPSVPSAAAVPTDPSVPSAAAVPTDPPAQSAAAAPSDASVPYFPPLPGNPAKSDLLAPVGTESQQPAGELIVPPRVASPAISPASPPVRTVEPQHAQADTMPRQATRRDRLGLALQAQEGDTLSTLYFKLYRGLTPPPYEQVVAANPEPVKPGSIIVFPAPPDGWTRRHAEAFAIGVMTPHQVPGSAMTDR